MKARRSVLVRAITIALSALCVLVLWASAAHARDPGDFEFPTFVPAVEAEPFVAPDLIVGAEHTVEFRAFNEANGNPLSGDLEIEVAGANPMTTTIPIFGHATFKYVGKNPGFDEIFGRLTVDGIRVGAVSFITWLPSPGPDLPAGLTLTPERVNAAPGEESCVTATVLSGTGKRLPGAQVRFSVTGPNRFDRVRVTTDAQGEARFCYTSTKAGFDFVNAFADGDRDGTRDIPAEPSDVSLVHRPPGPPVRIVMEPAARSSIAGDTVCFVAHVFDKFGNHAEDVRLWASVTGTHPTEMFVPAPFGRGDVCHTTEFPGKDTIVAFLDADFDAVREPGEPFGTAVHTVLRGQLSFVDLFDLPAGPTVGVTFCNETSAFNQLGGRLPGEQLRFSVTGANSVRNVRQTTGAFGLTHFCYRGTRAGLDVIDVYGDRDRDGVRDPGEPTDTFALIWEPGPPASLALTPKTATNPVDTRHCATATLRDRFGNPTPNRGVRFTVSGANTPSGQRATGADGHAEFCWSSVFAGDDTLTARWGESSLKDTAAKRWVPPATARPCKVTGTDRLKPAGVASIAITAVTCAADRVAATVFGRATLVGGGTALYRLDVRDLGEPGRNDTHRTRMSNGFDSGVVRLASGNIQVH